MRKLIVSAVVLLGLFALPASASAFTFEPAAGSPLTPGTPQFDPPEIMPTGFSPVDVAAGDFNDDGYGDVAVAGEQGPEIFLYLGRSDGTLDPSSSNPIGSNSDVYGRTTLHATDLDQDGDLDLVAGTLSSEDQVEVYLNSKIAGPTTNTHEGFGTVPSSTPDIGVEEPSGYRSFTFGDKDDDGDEDVVIGLIARDSGAQGGRYVYLRNDEGELVPNSPVNVSGPGTGQPYDGVSATAIGDFDGDGEGDLAMVTLPTYDAENPRASRILVAKSNGENSFVTNPVTLVQSGASDYVEDVQTIDLNGDQFDDLIFKQQVDGEQSNRTALGSASGLVLQTAGDTSVEVYGASPVVVGDFNNDDNQDVVLPQFVDAAMQVATGDGTGKLSLLTGDPFGIPQVGGKNFYPQMSDSFDFDGDGALDVALVSGNTGSETQGRGVAIMVNKQAPGIVVSPTDFHFGQVPADAELIAPAQFTITSNGELPLDLGDISLSGGNTPERFSLDRGNCPTGNLAPGSSCTVEVTMLQSQSGYLDTYLHITNDATAEPIEVQILGQVLEPDPVSTGLSLKVTSGKKVKAGKKLVVTATIRNSGADRSAHFDLRAAAPKKLTGKIKPASLRNLSIAGNHTSRFRFTIPVKSKAKGKFQVKVSLSAADRAIKRMTPKVRIVRKKTKKPGRR